MTLTAGAAPTFGDIAAIASDVTQRTVRIEVAEPDAWSAAQMAAGAAGIRRPFTLGMYLAAESGFFAGTDPLLT